jgi:hypothetical protein
MDKKSLSERDICTKQSAIHQPGPVVSGHAYANPKQAKVLDSSR